jgi:hypothetical protein
MIKLSILRAISAGIVATLIMTIVMSRLPIIGYPAIDVISALGALSAYVGAYLPFRVSPYLFGAAVHFMIGVILAFIYAVLFFSSLPGPKWFKGVVFSFFLWLFVITLLGPSLQFASHILRPTSSSTVANPSIPVNPCTPPGTDPYDPPTTPCTPQQTNPSEATLLNPWIPSATDRAATCPQLPSLIGHLIYGLVLGIFYRHRFVAVKLLR